MLTTSLHSLDLSMLAEKLNVFLGCISGGFNGLGTLAGAVTNLLGFALDFRVQSFEYREDRASQRFGCLLVHVTLRLGVCSQILEQASNTAQILVKVVAFFEWAADSLQNFVVVL